MKRMLINATQPEEVRVALVDGKKLYNFIAEHPGYEERVGNIYKIKITSIEPSLNAVFGEFGGERHGFLPLKEISKEYFATQDRNALERGDVKELLRMNQELIVQVEKEERGNKGAALTTFISLAGSYLVLMPNNPRAGGISRRIENTEERDSLRGHLSKLELPEGMGLIIRTAGVNKSLEELQWDLNILLEHWKTIKSAAEKKPAPFLIHRESRAITRSIRDYLSQDIDEIVIDNPDIFKQVKEYISLVRPTFVDRLKLYQEVIPLFNRYEVEHQIESAYQRVVNLPSGGSIVIDHSEALVSIDINSSRATKGADIEETAFNINLEAAEEIARQLRLRDIGGLIVIDFIDMKPIRHQREVESHLRNALRVDRARVQVGRISRFGLLEMSRQRLRGSLKDSIHVRCPRCNGQGTIRSVESLALSMLRIIEEDAIKTRTEEIQVHLPVESATYLLNEKRNAIHNLENQHAISIVIIPNPYLQSPDYQIKRIRAKKHKESGQASYEQIETPKPETIEKTSQTIRNIEEPAVKGILRENAPVTPATTNTPNLIKRLWKNMFGATNKKASSQEEKPRKPQQRSNRGSYERRSTNKRSASSHADSGSRSGSSRGSSRTNSPRGRPRNKPSHSDKSSNYKNRTRRGSRGGTRKSYNTSTKPRLEEKKESTPEKEKKSLETYPDAAQEAPVIIRPQKDDND